MYANQLKLIAAWYLVNKNAVPNPAERVEIMVRRLASRYPAKHAQRQYRSGLNRTMRFIEQLSQEVIECPVPSDLETSVENEMKSDGK